MNLLVEQGPAALMLALAIGHALADFPLQGSWLAEQKSRHQASSKSDWLVALAAHSLIHCGAVWLITGSVVLGIVEFFLHAFIDTLKAEKKIGLLGDQALHLVCKLGYVMLLIS